MNNEFEQLKQTAYIKALRGYIEERRRELCDKTWEGIKRGDRYSGLDQAINQAEGLLTRMKTALIELQKLESDT